MITADFHRKDIERKIAEDADKYRNLHFYYVSRTRWSWLEKIWPPAYLWTYRMWQRKAYRLAVQLHKTIGFDLAHQLTYVGFRIPGYLWKLDIPFVWGPIGGLENTNWNFLRPLGLQGALYYTGRNIMNSLHKRFLRIPKRAFSKAEGGIIAATEGIRQEILKWYGRESSVICEIGLPVTPATTISVRKDNMPLRLVWSGWHLPGKALPLLLHALTRVPKEVQWELDVQGSGRCTAKWTKMSSTLGINERCRWHGWIPRAEAIEMIHRAHVIVITSLKDLTSTVLLEALSQGVPVICLDHCGFQNVVTEDCGIKVPVRNPEEVIDTIAVEITALWHNEKRRQSLAMGAVHRSLDFSWDKKAVMIDKIYHKVVNGDTY